MNKIEAMHKQYGITLGAECGDCVNFRRYRANRVYFKCMAYGNSSSEATDWRCHYKACGLYNIAFDGTKTRPLIQTLDRTKHKEPLEGQLKIEER